jgi:3-oxoacyl-[acyl-carrier-protein] synthase II
MGSEVAITGVGVVTPLGAGVDRLLQGWLAGESAIEDGQALCDFDPSEFLSRRELRHADRFTQLAVAACEEAVQQAGWQDGSPYPSNRVACVIGTSVGGMHTIEEEHARLLNDGPTRVSPLAVTRLMANAPAATLSMRHHWTGESYGLVSACAAGTQALGAGLLMVRAGVADAAVVGGADAHFTSLISACFDVMRGTSRVGVARPFDRRRDGFVPGEGAGLLILENLASAKAREATILGTVIGYCSTTDAYHLAVPRPDGNGAREAMNGALADAGIAPAQVAYINAHGTATRRNDELETRAIAEIFAPGTVKVSSLKSSTGHLQGAAGAVEAVATLSVLRAGIAPPTVGLEEPEDDLLIDYVRERPSNLHDSSDAGAIGLSNSFGLGGHNASIVIQADRTERASC